MSCELSLVRPKIMAITRLKISEIRTSRRIASSTALIAASHAVGQLSLFMAVPILSRGYGPETFGLYSIAFSVAVTVAIVASFRLELAIPLTNDPQTIRSLIILSLGVALVVSLGLSLALTIVPRLAWEAVDLPLVISALLIPIMVFLTALFNLQTQILIARKGYKSVAARSLVGPITTAAAQISLIPIQIGSLGLMVGFIFGRLASLAVSITTFRAFIFGRLNRQEVRLTWRRFRRFGSQLTLASAMNSIGGQLPLLAVAFMFGPVTAGYIGVLTVLITAPAGLVWQASSQVLYGEVAESRRMGLLVPRTFLLGTAAKLSLVGFVLAATVIALPDWVWTSWLGQSWSGVSTYAPWVALVAGASIVGAPMQTTLVAAFRTVMNLSLDVTRVITVGGAGLICHFLDTSAEVLFAVMSSILAANLLLTTAVAIAVGAGRLYGRKGHHNQDDFSERAH